MSERYRYVLNVLTKDHPGIVAGVSSAVGALDGTVLSCSQTVLHGYFTLISIVAFPKNHTADELTELLRRHDSLGERYLISAAKAEPTGMDFDSEGKIDEFVITAFGSGETGIIERFSHYAADHDINIIDLFGDQGENEFVIIAQLQVPQRFDPRVLQDDLEEIGRELDFTIKLQHKNIFVATNQLRLSDTW